MTRYRFKKIDAFTGPGSSGNPAACVYLDREIPGEQMQRIARELKGFVSEVVYCRLLAGTEAPAYALRYFSSECEVEFCGHGTIACLYDLIAATPALSGRSEIALSTRKGPLVGYNRLAVADAVFIQAPSAVHTGSMLGAEMAAEALNIPAGWVDARYPIDRINAGLETLIVPIDSLRHTVAMLPAMEPLKRFCEAHGIDIVTVFTVEVAEKAHLVRTRVFAPKYGYLEDPATGSGNSAVGYYLLKNQLWQGGLVAVEQGPSLEAPNVVRLDSLPDLPAGRRVLFGGGATVRIEGEYLLG
jgi:PhzF family phenazine biosynthesis protein